MELANRNGEADKTGPEETRNRTMGERATKAKQGHTGNEIWKDKTETMKNYICRDPNWNME